MTAPADPAAVARYLADPAARAEAHALARKGKALRGALDTIAARTGESPGDVFRRTQAGIHTHEEHVNAIMAEAGTA